MSGCGFRYRLGANALLNPQLGRRRMTHLEAAVCGRWRLRRPRNNPRAGSCGFSSSRRQTMASVGVFDPTDPDHAANAGGQQCLRRGPGKGEIEDLIRLLARHRRLIERTHLHIRFQPGERFVEATSDPAP